MNFTCEQVLSLSLSLSLYIYIYMRWIQVTPGVILKSYTFFKSLDLNRFNGKKKKKTHYC